MLGLKYGYDLQTTGHLVPLFLGVFEPEQLDATATKSGVRKTKPGPGVNTQAT